MIRTPPRTEFRTMRSVVLEHRDTGELFAWTYTTATREAAVQRAFLALKRDMPDAHPTDWKVSDE